eukprot:111014-Chlamydomonas_euryale.AAC.2
MPRHTTNLPRHCICSAAPHTSRATAASRVTSIPATLMARAAAGAVQVGRACPVASHASMLGLGLRACA